MKHRYGRHGDKAWLRWRKKHFRRTSLVPAPQMAVLHVPLEFLSRIRKVTILMADGTEQIIDINVDPLPFSSVNGDTEEIAVKELRQISGPPEGFFATAKENARYDAERIFRDHPNPYIMKPDVVEARKIARLTYSAMQLAPKLSLSTAVDDFVNKFKAEYWKHLAQLSTESGADTEETQKLLVFARTDKVKAGAVVTEHARDQALVRAYISLFSNDPLCQEDVNEDALGDLRERVGLYQKFYAEFEPAKEED